MQSNQPDGPIRVLRILARMTETAASYNQFSLALRHRHQITLCTYKRTDIVPPPEIEVFQGDSTWKGFFRALRAATQGRSYDVVHVHSPFLGMMYLLATAGRRRNAAPAMITVHNSLQNFKFRNQLLLLPAFAAFAKVVCCSRSSIESFPAIYRWLGGKRVCAIQNGADVPRIDRVLCDRARGDGGPFTVASVGRLLPLKNPQVLLDAFAAGTDSSARLRFVGDGTLREPLAAASNVGQLQDRVEFTGLIPRDEVYGVLQEADLFVSTSKGEGLPLATLEAMACRCPVVLSDIPPHQEIAQGVDFIPLVHANDTEGFARHIRRHAQMPAEERAHLGERCRQHVEEYFSVAAMHAGYDRVYRELCGRAAIEQTAQNREAA